MKSDSPLMLRVVRLEAAVSVHDVHRRCGSYSAWVAGVRELGSGTGDGRGEGLVPDF